MDTRFHIDLEWWEQSGKEFKVVIQQMCDEYGSGDMGEIDRHREVDWIDPDTGQVERVDAMMYIFLTQCSRNPEFITERTALTEACFRALLASGNHPMTPHELAMRTGRPAEMILKTLSGRTVYKGIRPYVEVDEPSES
jgi:hypothetical protein